MDLPRLDFCCLPKLLLALLLRADKGCAWRTEMDFARITAWFSETAGSRAETALARALALNRAR